MHSRFSWSLQLVNKIWTWTRKTWSKTLGKRRIWRSNDSLARLMRSARGFSTFCVASLKSSRSNKRYIRINGDRFVLGDNLMWSYWSVLQSRIFIFLCVFNLLEFKRWASKLFLNALCDLIIAAVCQDCWIIATLKTCWRIYKQTM